MKKLVRLSRKFQPWDFQFMLEIEYEMLKEMYKFYSSDKPVSIGKEIIAKDIKLAINLLNIVLEKDNNDYSSFNKHVNIKNSKRFKIIIKSYPIDIVLYELRRTKALYLYNKLRYYKIQTWWD